MDSTWHQARRVTEGPKEIEAVAEDLPKADPADPPALPLAQRKLFMKWASSETGRIPWSTCRSFLQFCKKKEKEEKEDTESIDDFEELEDDLRLLTSQMKKPKKVGRLSGFYPEDHVLHLDFPSYVRLMQSNLSDLPQASQKRLADFGALLKEEAQNEHFSNWKPSQRKSLKLMTLEDIPQSFILEFAPAFVILVNAVVIGVSLDQDPEALQWQVLEWFFTAIFSMEALMRMRLLGCSNYFTGADSGWNYFDLMCLACAYTDIIVTASLQLSDGDSSSGLDGIMLIKILRLGRVCRLIRVMRFGAVRELRVIILGVLSGIRVLFWAIVLLFFTVYVVGVSARMIIPEEEEFKSTQAAMMTIFRCVTDGCSTIGGAPLQEKLRDYYGVGFMLIYMVLFLFVVIGIFNLIMAVFLDSVLNDHEARELQELGEKSQEMEKHISNVISTLVAGQRIDLDADKPKSLCEWICSFCKRKKSARKAAEVASKVQREMNQEVVVARADFTKWLEYPEMMEMLSFCKIETATKYDLFDVLDAEMCDELNFHELVDGLMRLRGPITKVDVIALRLKMRYLVRLLQQIANR